MLTDTFQLQHFSCMCFRQDESSVIAGTSEGTVVQFQFLPSSVDQQDKEWVRTRTFKNHSHDVKALVLTDTAVVSGGQCLICCTFLYNNKTIHSAINEIKGLYIFAVSHFIVH